MFVISLACKIEASNLRFPYSFSRVDFEEK